MQQQTGAVLVFCLVFLLVLTVMGVNSVETALLESGMASSMHQHQRTVSIADTVLRKVERRVMSGDGISGTVESGPDKPAGSTVEVSYRIVQLSDEGAGEEDLSGARFDILIIAVEQGAGSAVRLRAGLHMACDPDVCRYTRTDWRLLDVSPE